MNGGWYTPFTRMGGKTPIERLRELVESPKNLSGSRIAEIFTQEGFPSTRSKIVSKAAALKLRLKGGKGGVRAGAPHAPPAPKPAPEPEVVEEPLVLDDGSHATVLTINDRMCRWPIGDPAENTFHYCGRTPKAGRPYCEPHAKKAYQPQTGRGYLGPGRRSKSDHFSG